MTDGAASDATAGPSEPKQGAGASSEPMEGADAPRWFACYTRARHEKKVDALLRERGHESYLPLVPRERQWHDRKKVVEFPLFPSYVFVRIRRDGLSAVLSTPGVSTVVRFGGRPVPIPEEEIENVRRFTAALREGEEGAEVESAPLVTEGQRVRVASGSFEGVRGIVIQRRGRDRVLIQVGVEAIRQGLKVEVPAEVLDPLEEERDPGRR